MAFKAGNKKCMYRITIEKFEVQNEASGYTKETEKMTVFEQVLPQLDVKLVANYINSNPGVNS